MSPSIQILQGNALDALKTLPSESVQCVVTSPPYWGMRDYSTESQIWRSPLRLIDCTEHAWEDATPVNSALGLSGNRNEITKRANTTSVKGGKICLRCNAWKGELGLEPTPDMFIQHLVQIFHETKRVLKNDGTLWLNLGDTYVGSSQGWGTKPETLSSVQKGNKGSLHNLDHAPVNYRVPGLKKKDLCGIPWRTALALQRPHLRCKHCSSIAHYDYWGKHTNGRLICPFCAVSKGHDVAEQGWYLRSAIIWHKPNAMPESVKDRPTKSYETIFLLTKSEKYFYDADAIREPHKTASLARAKHEWNGNRDVGRIAPSFAGMTKEHMCHPLGKNKRDVWILSTKGTKDAHFATFPREIPYTCIRAGSRIGDTVLDPFVGSGTTAEEAFLLRRNSIGIELNKKYISAIITPRINRLISMENTMNKLFAYPGGKHPIRNLVVSHFPKHLTYVDVFGGSATILLTKEPSKGEAFNDKNELIANFFRVVKHRPSELAERARHWIHSRKMFDQIRDAEIPKDELEKAFYFWVILADSFGARGLNFGTSKKGIHSVTHARLYLNAVSERLEGVHVENLDFSKCIKIYDAPDTLFYLDPPYRGTRGGSTNYDLLTDDEWKELRRLCGKMKGKFLLSSNNDTFVLELFKGFHVKTIDVPVTLPRKKENKTRKEVFIANYQLKMQNAKLKKG
ncbi:MAG: hypothetical protein EPO24_15830 [Bacteroidetes bacterium]|nr:MAG: hypothetical protein EPO24_15830 [Bacteroidota bacterium]